MLLLSRLIVAIAAFFGFIVVSLGITPTTVRAPATNVPAPIPAVTHTEVATTTSVTYATTTKPVPATTTKPKPTTPAVGPSASTPAVPAPTPVPAPAETDKVRAAVVNIICITGNGSPLESISASGVIIDPRGIILTNAHVAQHYLLKDYPTKNAISCTIRTGSPARPMYTATLLFISPSWVADNASQIMLANPSGTGEHDYALLVMTGVANNTVVPPASFPYLPIGLDNPVTGKVVQIAAYPAGFLGGLTIQKDLYETSAQTTIGTLYTFGTVTPDLFSVGGTVLSQHGSSGGAVADASGTLIGLIVTATDGEQTATRDLRALATSYLVRDFATEAGMSLSTYLGGDILAEAAAFNRDIAPALIQKLVGFLQ